jgi:tetratricopeptide (TPR) repeat protein
MLKKLVFAVVIISCCLVLNSCQKTADEHYNNAMEFTKSKDFSSAINELDKAIEINPNFAKAYLDRGRFRFTKQFSGTGVRSEQGDSAKLSQLIESSIKDFSKAMELDKNLATDALIGRGNAYLTMKFYNKAISDFEEVLKKDSANKQIVWITAHCKFMLKDSVGAKSLLNRIIRINPNDAENYYTRAVYELIMFNDKNGACEDLNQANKLYNANEKYLAGDLKAEIEKLIKINCTK